MEDLNNSQEKNPFKTSHGLIWYSSMDGSSFSNFDNEISQVDRPKYERIVLNQAIEQVIYGIETYLQTRDLGATQVFSHGLVYMTDIIKEDYPEAGALFKMLYENVESLGTDREINLKEIADNLRDIKLRLNLSREEYFKFAEERGVSKERILTECIYYNLSSMIPRWKTPENISEVEKEWKSLKDESFEEFIKKSKDLLNLVIEFNIDVKTYSNYSPLIKALEDADLSSNIRLG